MKKKLVSLVALASLFVIAGCGDNKESTKPETSAPSPVETAKPTEAPKPTETAKPTEKPATDPVTEAPSTEAPSTETPSTEAPTPSVPEMVEKTIDELTTTAPEDSKTMFKVSGIWEHTGNDSDVNGSGNFVDPVSGKSLTIYAVAPTAEAFTYDVTKGFTFTNPRKFQEIKSNFTSGDKLTLGMLYSPTFNNYYAYFISKDADKSTFTYNVEIGTFEHGSIAADKTSGTYGEKVTLTVTPDTDYAVEFIKLNDKAVTAVDGVYSFGIVAGKNIITAEFVTTATPITSATLTPETLSLGSYPKAESTLTLVDGRNNVEFKYMNIGYYASSIQIKNYSGGKNLAYLYNTAELAGEIDSLTIVTNTKWATNETTTAGLIVSFGSAAITARGEEKVDDSNVIRNTTTTISCTTAGAKFIRFDNCGGGAMNIDSITINFKTAA